MAKKRVTWFRIYTTNRGAIESISDEKVGMALKAAFRYFGKGEVDEDASAAFDDPETRIAFGIFKQGIDDSIEEYEARVEDGKKGAEERKKREIQKALEERMNVHDIDNETEEEQMNVHDCDNEAELDKSEWEEPKGDGFAEFTRMLNEKRK